jgi:flagellar basal-body rod protein FlgB
MRFDLDKAFGIHQQGILIRSKRAEILAGNLANADTPNFKARDIDFKMALSQSMQKNDATRLTLTNPQHMSGKHSVSSAGNGMGMDLLYRSPLQPSIDGNTVDAQTEKAQFATNALQYQASLQFLSGSIKSLTTAIRGE